MAQADHVSVDQRIQTRTMYHVPSALKPLGSNILLPNTAKGA